MVEVEVTEVSRRGDGVAKIRGFIIFIPNTKPGTKIRVKITRVGPTYAVAQPVEAQQGEASGESPVEESSSEEEGLEEE